MRIDIDYGRGTLPVEVPDGNLAGVLRTSEVKCVGDVGTAVRGALEKPIGCAPLGEIARGRSDACVVIPDKTRPLPNAEVLPAVLSTLEAAGIPREKILILVATGLHRPNEGDELVDLVGAEIAATYRCENHVARDEPAHVDLGVTSLGVPVSVDRRYVRSQLKVLVGLVEPHFMAGFSGGRKMVCPGICAARTICAFHSPPLLENPRATTAVLEGNPVHETALETARSAGVDFTVNVAINETREVAGVFAGELEKAHESTCAFVAGFTTAYVSEKVPIVVTSAGGFPLDDTFYQAVKGMVGPLPILRHGGTVIIAAAVGEGIGSEEYTRTMRETDDWRAFMAWIKQPGNFVIDQWELEMQAKVMQHGEIMMFSDGMTDEEIGSCFVTPVSSVEEGIRRALAKHGPGARIAVIPQGPYVITRVG